MNLNEALVLIGMQEGPERNELVRRVARNGQPREAFVTSRLTDLESRAGRLEPRVIVLSDDTLDAGVSLSEIVRRLAIFAPVVVLASMEQQSWLASLVTSGEVDFVARAGDFVPMAAALVARRLRAPQPTGVEFASAWTADLPSDFAEILRHEINNPLTGILGNAELLLTQLRTQLAPVSVQRLETIVDLAVRLRETIRRVSKEWEQQHSTIPSG